MAFEPDQEPMLLAVERARAKEILAERQTLGSELRARAAGVSDVAAFTVWNDDVREWEQITARTLESIFTTRRAAAAFESERIKRISLERETHAERFDRRQEDLRREVAHLMELRNRLYAIEEVPSPVTAHPPVAPAAGHARVFLVHGRDDGPKTIVLRLLEQTRAGDHEIVILSEMPSRGLTTLDELASAADYAVVVASADDLARPNRRYSAVGAPPEAERRRADQNLIFELGYLVGKLGPARVTVLYQHGTELPLEHPGVNYAELDAGGNWRLGLLEGLRNAGLSFDPDRLA